MYNHLISHLTSVQVPDDQWLTNDLTQDELISFFSDIIEINECWQRKPKYKKRIPKKYKPIPEYQAFKYRDKQEANHRLMFVICFHPIPRGFSPHQIVIDHICNNKQCFNPNHLQMITHAMNIKRAKPPQ